MILTILCAATIAVAHHSFGMDPVPNPTIVDVFIECNATTQELLQIQKKINADPNLQSSLLPCSFEYSSPSSIHSPYLIDSLKETITKNAPQLTNAQTNPTHNISFSIQYTDLPATPWGIYHNIQELRKFYKTMKTATQELTNQAQPIEVNEIKIQGQYETSTPVTIQYQYRLYNEDKKIHAMKIHFLFSTFFCLSIITWLISKKMLVAGGTMLLFLPLGLFADFLPI